MDVKIRRRVGAQSFVAVASRHSQPGRNDLRDPDRLDYMADMVLELKQMAERSGFVTLAAIFAVAHVEAVQQSGTTKN